MSPQKKPVLSEVVLMGHFCSSVRNTSVCHLVMRIKRLNDATVAAESPPSEHEQIFDLSQVIRSVGEELQTRKRKLVLMIFISFPLYSTQCFIVSCSPECVGAVLTWCSSGGRLSGVYSKLRQLSSSLCTMSAWDWTGRASDTCSQEERGAQRSYLNTPYPQITFLQPSAFPRGCNGLQSIFQKEAITWSPLLSACSLSMRKKETSFGGETELKVNWDLI